MRNSGISAFSSFIFFAGAIFLRVTRSIKFESYLPQIAIRDLKRLQLPEPQASHAFSDAENHADILQCDRAPGSSRNERLCDQPRFYRAPAKHGDGNRR